MAAALGSQGQGPLEFKTLSSMVGPGYSGIVRQEGVEKCGKWALTVTEVGKAGEQLHCGDAEGLSGAHRTCVTLS